MKSIDWMERAKHYATLHLENPNSPAAPLINFRGIMKHHYEATESGLTFLRIPVGSEGSVQYNLLIDESFALKYLATSP